MCNLTNNFLDFFVVIINKQTDLFSLTFYLNVEFIAKSAFIHKNPLTMQKNECIMISATEKIATTKARK